MTFRAVFLLAFLLPSLCLVHFSASADSSVSVGQVTLALGDAVVIREDGSSVPASEGASLYVGDRLETKLGGHIHLRFIDGALVSVRPGSRLTIDTYHFDPKQPELNAVRFILDEGLTRSISGQAAKNQDRGFRLNTPVAAIGVRGTDFTVSASQDSVRTFVTEGAIVVSPFTDHCDKSSFGPCAAEGVNLDALEQQFLSLESGLGELPLVRFSLDEMPTSSMLADERFISGIRRQVTEQRLLMAANEPLQSLSDSVLETSNQEAGNGDSTSPQVTDTVIDPDTETTTDSALDSDRGTQQETPVVAGSGTEPEAPVVADSGTEPEAPVVADSGTEPEAPVVADSGTEPEAPVVAVSGNEPETPVVADSGTEPETPVVADSGNEPEAPVVADNGNEPEAPVVADSGNEPETPLVADSGTEPEAPVVADSGNEQAPAVTNATAATEPVSSVIASTDDEPVLADTLTDIQTDVALIDSPAEPPTEIPTDEEPVFGPGLVWAYQPNTQTEEAISEAPADNDETGKESLTENQITGDAITDPLAVAEVSTDTQTSTQSNTDSQSENSAEMSDDISDDSGKKLVLADSTVSLPDFIADGKLLSEQEGIDPFLEEGDFALFDTGPEVALADMIGLGEVEFNLEHSFAFYHLADQVFLPEILESQLRIDFERGLFSTGLEMFHERTGNIAFAAEGVVNREGILTFDEDGRYLSGAVRKDGSQAGYYFEQPAVDKPVATDNLLPDEESGQPVTIQGVTLWQAREASDQDGSEGVSDLAPTTNAVPVVNP